MPGGQRAMPGGQKAMPGGQKAGLTGQDTAPPAAKAKPGIKHNYPGSFAVVSASKLTSSCRKCINMLPMYQ